MRWFISVIQISTQSTRFYLPPKQLAATFSLNTKHLFLCYVRVWDSARSSNRLPLTVTRLAPPFVPSTRRFPTSIASAAASVIAYSIAAVANQLVEILGQLLFAKPDLNKPIQAMMKILLYYTYFQGAMTEPNESEAQRTTPESNCKSRWFI